MNKRIYIVFVLTFLNFCSLAFGQQFFLRNFSHDEYLAGTQNWNIDFGKDQIVYFANKDGLLYYDGNRWGKLQIKNYTTVRSVTINEEEKRIYVGATNEFGYFYKNDEHSHVQYKSVSDLLPLKEHNFSEIWHIHKWNDKIIFQGQNALYYYDSTKEQLQTVHLKDRIEVSAIINNQLIVVTRNYLEIKSTQGKIRRIPFNEGMKNATIREVLPYGKDVLIATQNRGFFLFDGKGFLHFDTTIDTYINNAQVFSADIKDDMLAIGTVRDGLFLYNLKTQAVEHINSAKGMTDNTVLSVKFSQKGILWLGLDNGIVYVKRNSAFRQLIPVGQHIGTGYASIVFDKTLFLGTNQGLFAMNISPTGEPFGAVYPIASVSEQVWSLCNDNGRLLCCSDNAVYSLHGGKATRIDGTQGTWIVCPLKHHPGRLIASDYNGMFILRYEGGRYHIQNRLANLPIVSNNVLEDEDGSVWVGHWQQGIYRLTMNDDCTKATKVEFFHQGKGLPVNDGNNLCMIDGRVFVSSVDGFYSYDTKSHQLKKEKGLTSMFNTYDTSLKIHQAGNGDIWGYKFGYMAIAHHPAVGTQYADYTVDATSFKSINSRLQIGIGNTTTLNESFTLFNSSEGFLVINNNYTNAKEKSNVYIRNILATNNSDTLIYTSHLSKDTEKIRIDHRLNSLRIEFVMPEYRVPNSVMYSCYLEHYDKNWSAEQQACYKEYTHLAHGTYHFRVRARNLINGVVTESVIELEILPAWYETFWAYLLYLIIFIGLLYLVFAIVNRISTIKTNRKQEKQQQQMTELKSQNLESALHHKSSELASSTMDLVHKNDILQNLDSEMHKLSESVRREDPKREITNRINEIRKSIQASLNDDNNWTKVEESFDELYDNFMTRLNEQYPDLKTIDRKLCAYLRMGLSTKEIASLMNTTTRSIETARYRLRKKLKLEQADNLSNFIQNF